jgi:hypothetical protein
MMKAVDEIAQAIERFKQLELRVIQALEDKDKIAPFSADDIKSVIDLVLVARQAKRALLCSKGDVAQYWGKEIEKALTPFGESWVDQLNLGSKRHANQ